jgi:N utilization substance protein B
MYREFISPRRLQMNRSEARELVMKLIFQMDAQKNFSEDLRDRYLEENFKGNSQRDYFLRLIQILTEERAAIDETIDSSSDHWKLSRIAKVDLAITRTGAGEILFMDDVPDSVAINEAVNMAKKYSTEESGKYINGILGKIQKGKKADNSGRE